MPGIQDIRNFIFKNIYLKIDRVFVTARILFVTAAPVANNIPAVANTRNCASNFGRKYFWPSQIVTFVTATPVAKTKPAVANISICAKKIPSQILFAVANTNFCDGYARRKY